MRKGTFQKSIRIFYLLILSFANGVVNAGHVDAPVISIIIDDIGYRNVDDLKALELPGPITYAVMPHSPLSQKISEIAKESGKSILLHLPMEAIDHNKNVYLGPGALKQEMNEVQFISTLSQNLRSIPGAIGVNNHMGSLLTMKTEQMEWLMSYLYLRNIFYVDSMTNNNTVASVIAG
ncbi:MAG: divergent polysaccharide deacetylase family protein, partial [Candidatus Dadabacteria bacterium]|nr:divergent polysaccharide deacetylase family protein [Candidatus Dadabacteria bacterium]